MTISDSKTDPVPAIPTAKGTPARGAALVASIVGLILPAISSSAMGMSQSANMLELAGWFIIVPVSIAAATIMPGIAAQYSRLADIVAAVIALAVLAYAGYIVFDAWNQVSQITGQATGMMQGMAGNNPELQAYANDYSQTLGIGVSPGVGLAVTGVAVALMTKLVLRWSK